MKPTVIFDMVRRLPIFVYLRDLVKLKPDCCWILFHKQGIILAYNNEKNRKPRAE